VTPARGLPPGPIDGLGGGANVDPAHYGESVMEEVRRERASRRGRTVQALLALPLYVADAVAASRPILGVCRGARLLNVDFGGSLNRIGKAM
jgi:putative glutamine amidotransferase